MVSSDTETSFNDLEKAGPFIDGTSLSNKSSPRGDNGSKEANEFDDVYVDDKRLHGRFGWFWRMSNAIDALGEGRGVHRQPEDARGKGDWHQYASLALIWVGASGSLTTMTGFFVGPYVFNLGFKDSMSAGILGVFVGCAFASVGALIGPRSGLRQMVSTRFHFGWYPSKAIAVLNVLTLLGWSVINVVFGGQLLSALNSHIPLEIGILIISLVTIVVAVFGIRYVIMFDKVILGPTLIVLILVYVCTGSEYPTHAQSIGTSKDIGINWLTFFSSCIGITSTWVTIGSDYFVDLPVDTNPVFLYFFLFFCMFLPTVFLGCIGIGLACAARFSNPAWDTAYNNLGVGGVLAESLSKWHGGGKFLVVVMFISLVANNVLNNYSAALSSQVFGRFWTKIPRYILTIIVGIVYFVLGSAGRNKLYDILSNFMPMIGYWSMIYCTIIGLEMIVFRRRAENDCQWQFWNTKEHFPILYAAPFSFCMGVVGAVLGMDQTYYTGVLGRMIGEDGGDLGMCLGVGFTLISYIPLRAIEIAVRKERPIRP